MSARADGPLSLARRALVTGTVWSTGGEALAAIAELARQIVAARVLAPGDMGLMGIVLLQMAVLDALTKTGFEQALVQRTEGAEPLYDVAWTWQACRGLLLGGALALVSPLIARVYGEPALVPLMVAGSLHVALQGVHNIALVGFSRELDFRTLFWMNVLRAAAHAGVAIPAIVLLKNVWGLVIGLVAGTVVSAVASYVVHPYRPKLDFSLARAKKLASFGKWITLLTIMVFLIVQGDDLFVSRYLGKVALAFYVLAYDVSNLPTTKISHVLARVAFPAYARLQHDKESLRGAFVDVMRATMLLAAPVAVAIYFVMPHVVAHVIGEKWAPVVPIVRVLVASSVVRAFAALAGPLFQAVGRPDLDFKMNLPRFLVMLLLIWPACARFELVGAAWVVFVAICTTVPVWLHGVRRLLELSPAQVLGHNALAAVSAGILGLAFFGAGLVLAGDALRDLASVVLAFGLWLAAMAVLEKLTPWKLYSEAARLRAAVTAAR